MSRTRFLLQIAASHSLAYFTAGIMAMFLLDYRSLFETEVLNQYMRSIDSPWVAAGAGLQILRGLGMGLVLWPLRGPLFEEERGAFKLWGLLAGLGLLFTFGPSPGSFEGVIYTQLTWQEHIWGLPEFVVYSSLFCWVSAQWYRHPSRTKDWVIFTVVLLITAMSLIGVFLTHPDTLPAV